jgi:small subunit ribosomal protein S17
MKDHRRRLIGKVTSNKMMKTVVVQVDRRQRHPLYGKVVNRARRYKAHDELGCQMGDTVRIVESRPISKEKHWVVEAIVNKGYHVVLPDDSAITAAPAPATEAAPEEQAEPAGDAPAGGAE